jgi:sugar phosphate isomerase/epimerase
LLKIVRGVHHDCFGVNVDTGNFHGEDPYTELTKIVPYAVNVQVKTEIQVMKKPKEEADLKKLIDMLKAAKYRGYVVLEYEAAEDATKAVPRYLEHLKKLTD